MIDIIIPAYNSHKTIKQTLLSICMQNVSPLIDVYIIDDCSKKPFDYLIPLFITQDENEKEVSITSVKIITPQAYLATFYSLNCMLNVFKFGSFCKLIGIVF